MNQPQDFLPIGTTVRIKVEGLKGKLENRYRGKYKIHSITETGKYKLANNEYVLIRPFAASKLKQVADNDLDNPEGRMIRSRNTNGTLEYLIEYDNEEQEWQPADDLPPESIKVYEDATHRQHQTEQTSPIERTPKRYNLRSSRTVNFLSPC